MHILHNLHNSVSPDQLSQKAQNTHKIGAKTQEANFTQNRKKKRKKFAILPKGRKEFLQKRNDFLNFSQFEKLQVKSKTRRSKFCPQMAAQNGKNCALSHAQDLETLLDYSVPYSLNPPSPGHAC